MIPTTLSDYYKAHTPIYDVTRWAFLFGRNSLPHFYPKLPPNSNILDVGCGTGKQLRQLINYYPGSKVIGIDSSSEMLGKVNQSINARTEIIHGTYASNSFPSNSFDLIVFSYSFTMMGALDNIFSSVHNHLKLGGFILVVDFDDSPFPRFKKWMNINHVDMDSGLFSALQNSFHTRKFVTQRAYFGLYSFSTFLGRK